jgi:hypothetical protein
LKLKAPPGSIPPGSLKCDILVSQNAAFKWVNLRRYDPVAHIVQEAVPPHVVKPKVAGMFARLVNLSLRQPGGSSITGGDAVRAYRCGFVLRHLIEGVDSGAVVRYVRDEYQYEMKFVLSRPGVHDRKLDGDVFFEQHARVHYDFVMRECLPPLWHGHGVAQQRTASQLQSAASARGKLTGAASKMRLLSPRSGGGGARGGEMFVAGAGAGDASAGTSAMTSLAPTPRFPPPYSSSAVEPPHDNAMVWTRRRVVDVGAA